MSSHACSSRPRTTRTRDLIILTAEERAFCGAGDAAWFKAQIEDPRNFRAITPQANRIITSLLDLEKPIVCKLNGAAAGLGASLALLCDVIIANEKALIGDPHVKVGLVAERRGRHSPNSLASLEPRSC